MQALLKGLEVSLSYTDTDSLLATNTNLKKKRVFCMASHTSLKQILLSIATSSEMKKKVKRVHSFLFSTIFVLSWLVCKHHLFTGMLKKRKKKRGKDILLLKRCKISSEPLRYQSLASALQSESITFMCLSLIKIRLIFRQIFYLRVWT